MDFLGFSLLLLMFLSKVSLACAGVPSRVSFLIFQHGLHPFMNIALNFLLGLPLVLYGVWHYRRIENLGKGYLTMVFFLILMLTLEMILQHYFLENQRGLYSLAALASTLWLILLFGILLPVTLDSYQVLRFISTWSLNFVVVSLVILFVRPDVAFKGGRFIGVFKHIPYMVTCSTVGAIFTLGRFQAESRLLKRIWFGLGIVLSFAALLLTGTRSALAAALIAVGLWVLRTPSRSVGFRYFKYSATLVMTLVILFFGNAIYEYVHDVATGQQALLDREAQDGVASRMEEVERGWEYFQTSPWIGQGLLSKFSGKEDVDVTSYDSFKDPHNIFASAGVVGGWPFVIWTFLFVLLLIGLSVRGLMSSNNVIQIFAIYMLVQIPILFIYHWHLSLGGMADRFYWLCFGTLALILRQPRSESGV